MAQSLIPPSQVVRARRIELVDEHDDIKITLDARESGSVIRLWGKDGRLKASFGLLTSDQPALLFFDRYLLRVDLHLEDDGQPSLGMVRNRTLDMCEILLEDINRVERQAPRKVKKKPTQSKRKEG